MDDPQVIVIRSLIAEAKMKKGKSELTKAVDKGDADAVNIARRMIEATDEEPPERRRYMTNDPTVEKLGELLETNHRDMLLFRDELTGLLRNLDREGREGSRTFYLEAWNGTGRFTFDRIGRGTVEIEAACVSILGGIQPGPMRAYLNAALTGGTDDDGLMQRFQLLVWPDAPTDFIHVDRWPDTPARQRAWGVYERLDAIDADAMSADRKDDGIPWFRFDQAAQGIFDEWLEQHMRRIRAADMEPATESHLSKYVSLVPSLALLIHLADHPEGGPVGEGSLIAACTWAEYLETHAWRLHANVIAPEMTAAIELDKRLLGLEDGFKARDIYKRGWRFLDRETAPGALKVLEDYERVRGTTKEKDSRGGRPTTVYQVNPALRRA